MCCWWVKCKDPGISDLNTAIYKTTGGWTGLASWVPLNTPWFLCVTDGDWEVCLHSLRLLQSVLLEKEAVLLFGSSLLEPELLACVTQLSSSNKPSLKQAAQQTLEDLHALQQVRCVTLTHDITSVLNDPNLWLADVNTSLTSSSSTAVTSTFLFKTTRVNINHQNVTYLCFQKLECKRSSLWCGSASSLLLSSVSSFLSS